MSVPVQSSLPGLTLATCSLGDSEALTPFGGFFVGGHGPLHSAAMRGDRCVHVDGVLTAGRVEGQTDAEVALEAFERGGLAGLQGLEGFYNVVAICRSEGRAWVVSDPLATRPLYIYERDGVAAVAPEAGCFARAGLPMSVDRLGLYEMFRLQHPVGPRTMITELTRSRPFTAYALSASGEVEHLTDWPITKAPEPGLDVDAAAQRMHDISAEITRDLLSHPRLRELPIHLPLTAGMDSRHILADLQEQGRLPGSIRHVRLNDDEVRPVRLMADALEVPLHEVDIGALDLREILTRWVRRTAGMVSLHQCYLFGVEPGASEAPVLGFDGYLADYFYGFCPMKRTPAQRHYTHPPVLRRLFGEETEALGQGCLADIAEQEAHYEGSDFFKQTMTDATNRGAFYTGAIFPLLADHALYLAPGGHRRAFEFFRTTPHEAAGLKRARLRLFQRHFPMLGGFADAHGVSYLERDTLASKKKGGLGPAWRFLRGLLGGGEPAPDTEHAWLRQLPVLRRVHERAVTDSWLARDGLIEGAVLADLWRRHQRGGYHAWPLMSAATVEVAYRLLVCAQPEAAVLSWLLEGAD